MKHSRLFLISLILLFALCGKREMESNQAAHGTRQETVQEDCNASSEINRRDSLGVFRGKLVFFADTSYRRSQAGMLLTTARGDTVIFNVDYDDEPKVDPAKMKIGSCVEVSYYAEIQRVEVDSSPDGVRGDEISRHFYVKELKHL